MAHPSFVIEQYVYHFLSHWSVGLQPSLTLDAKPNGEIALSLNLITSLSSNHSVEQSCTPSFRSSGRGSRIRRRVRRAAARASEETPEASISSNVGSAEDRCAAIDNLPVDNPVLEEPIMSVKCLLSHRMSVKNLNNRTMKKQFRL